MSDREDVFGPDAERFPSGWVWCLHCARTYRVDQFRQVRGYELCPYDDCDGNTVIDAWSWEQVRSEHAEYPVEPLRGVMYPL
jgi:hypothetical protein